MRAKKLFQFKSTKRKTKMHDANAGIKNVTQTHIKIQTKMKQITRHVSSEECEKENRKVDKKESKTKHGNIGIDLPTKTNVNMKICKNSSNQ